MKRAVVTFLLIFVTMGWAVAQNNPYRINDKLYDYYMECRSHIDEPIVLNMLDTLNHRAAAVGDVKAQCMAHTARVDYYYAIKNIEKMRQEQKRAYDFIVKTPYKQYIFSGWNRIVAYYMQKENYVSAMQEINLYQDEAYKLNDNYGINRSFVRMGDIFLELRMYKLAIAQYQKSVEYSKSTNQLQDIAYVYGVLARCYVRENQLEKAEDIANLALQSSRAAGQKQNAFISLFEIARKKGQWEKALELCDSIDILHQAGAAVASMENVDNAKLRRASMYLHLGKEKEAVEIANNLRMEENKNLFLISWYKYKQDYTNLLRLSKEMDGKSDSLSKVRNQMQFQEFMEAFNKRVLQDEQDKFSIRHEEMRLQQILSQRLRDSLQREQDTLILQQQNLEYARINTQIRLIQEQASQQQDKERVEQKHNMLRQRTLGIGILIMIGLVTVFFVLLFFIIKKTKRLKKERLLALQAQQAAEEADRQKTEFLHNMNHEIRTPLNAIVGFSDLLSSEMEYLLSAEEKEQMLKEIEDKSTYLQSLVNDVLDLSKLESGTYQFAKNEFALSTLCKEETDCARLLVSAGVGLRLKIEKDIQLVADRQRLGQLLHELLQNAARHTTSGYIELECSILNDSMLQFAVTDTGYGIPEGQEEAIFNRFYKLDQFAPGFGLGLCICRTIAQLLHGDVVLDTTYKQGARFVAKVSCE